MSNYSHSIITLNPSTHLLEGVKNVPSPNQDTRPEKVEPSLIVVHGISLPPGEFGGDGVEQLFTNQLNPKDHPYYQEIAPLKVSAHCFIRRDGEIIQFVPFNQRAWHAGASSFKGQESCNDFSIGVELEGTDDLPYTEAQYQQLNQLIALLQKTYPKIEQHVVGHSDIAPGRKTDPGSAFQWDRVNT
jgi:AmpD protein